MAGEHMLPDALLQSLKNIPGFDENAFVQAHDSGDQVVSVRLNPLKSGASFASTCFPGSEKIPWSSFGYYLPARPSFTFDPLFHAGVYYVQEASGMFIEQCVKAHHEADGSLKVLDLCAAPGGKSTLLQSIAGPDSLLVSNEVIKSRVNVLVENITKWGGGNVVVTNNDPRDFQRLPSFFDIMLIDAPCSGSGLFRRDAHAIEEWSPGAVTVCSQRQQRILSDAYPVLRNGGLLIYSTCSYSEIENEDICDWLIENFDVEPLRVPLDPEWHIIETSSKKHAAPGYRFFPHLLKGEGFFVACFRKRDGGKNFPASAKDKLVRATPAESVVAGKWLEDPERYTFFRMGDEVFCFPVALAGMLGSIQSDLYIKKAGITLGKIIKNELLPSHDLAVSGICRKNLVSVSLNLEESIQYLRKQEVTLSSGEKGWTIVQYEGFNLGWIKILGNRANNYYPKEWRILKAGNK